MIGINKGPVAEGLETVFSRVKAEPSPKALGRGEIIAVVFQNPLLKPDGVTSNNAQVLIGGGSIQPYLMIPGQESPIFYAEDLKDIYIKLLFPLANPNGVITAAAITTPGTGYGAGDVLTLPKSQLNGTDATVTLLTVGGAITGAAIGAGGAGYLALDVLNVTGGGGAGGQIRVDTVDGGGAVLTFTILAGGAAYQDTAGAATAGGAGAGATFDITTPNGVLTFNVTTGGTGFSVGDVIAATGGAGADAVFTVSTVDDSQDTETDITCIIYRLRKGGRQ